MTAVQHDPTAFLLDRISVLERRLHKAYTEVHEQRRRAELWRARALNKHARRGLNVGGRATAGATQGSVPND